MTAPWVCAWCGRSLTRSTNVGRRRRYCSRSCRQRAYEQRQAMLSAGLPTDVLMLSSADAADLADRVYQLRCAAEDLVTAVAEGAQPDELDQLGRHVASVAKALESIRNSSQ